MPLVSGFTMDVNVLCNLCQRRMNTARLHYNEDTVYLQCTNARCENCQSDRYFTFPKTALEMISEDGEEEDEEGDEG